MTDLSRKSNPGRPPPQPVTSMSPESMASASAEPSDPAPAVLVVDDRPDNLVALDAVLEGLPCRIVHAESGPAALKALLHEEFALVLMDVQMPGLDGYETARHIKMRERTRLVPIIFLSAIDTDAHHYLRGYDSGAVDFIPKPVLPEVVRSKVAVFLEMYQQARHIRAQRAALEVQVEEINRASEALVAQTNELTRSNAELERWSLAASHELIEPLQVAAGFLALLAERHPSPSEEGALLLERSRRAIARSHDRVESLLAYAAASTEVMTLGPVDLEKVTRAALAELAEEVETTNARVTCDPMPTVVGDEWQLRSLITELVSNALRHGGTQPDVHIGVSRQESEWVLTVHDSGLGTDADVLAAAFDLAHGPVTSLGLALCRRIVERHHGRIWAQSAPGVGTSVSFTLSPAELGEHE
jgi:two-component system, sensor histidine kinase and response regulator